MRETTESIAKRRACGVSTESIDMLFAPRKLRVRGNGKYFADHWAGVTRIVVASTGRIVAVFEDSMDALRTKNLLNNDSSERKSKAEMERLREQIKCGHSMELDALARERDELLVENGLLKLVQESALKVCAQLDEVVIALPFDYLDLPDGGDVSLGEQVSRMYSEVKNLRRECVATRTVLAAAEARETKLREALKKTTKAVEYRWEHIANRASPIWETEIDLAHTDGVKALAQPRDDSALREMIASVYEECERALRDRYDEFLEPEILGAIREIRALAEKAKGK